MPVTIITTDIKSAKARFKFLLFMKILLYFPVLLNSLQPASDKPPRPFRNVLIYTHLRWSDSSHHFTILAYNGKKVKGKAHFPTFFPLFPPFFTIFRPTRKNRANACLHKPRLSQNIIFFNCLSFVSGLFFVVTDRTAHCVVIIVDRTTHRVVVIVDRTAHRVIIIVVDRTTHRVVIIVDRTTH